MKTMQNPRIITALFCLFIIFGCFTGCESYLFDESTADSAPQSNSIQVDTTAPEEKTTSPAEYDPFDDAVFVGDSVTLKLSYYCEEYPEALGGAQFFCAGSLGYTNSLWELDHEDAVHPFYRGETCLSSDCAAITGAHNVFIMLGINDIDLYGLDESLQSAETLVAQIRAKSPGVSIYIQSVTPVFFGKETGELTNENIRLFNDMLRGLCEKSDCKYLDIYGLLADGDGYLPSEYCGDQEAQGIHFTDAACELWVKYLRENV